MVQEVKFLGIIFDRKHYNLSSLHQSETSRQQAGNTKSPKNNNTTLQTDEDTKAKTKSQEKLATQHKTSAAATAVASVSETVWFPRQRMNVDERRLTSHCPSPAFSFSSSCEVLSFPHRSIMSTILQWSC